MRWLWLLAVCACYAPPAYRDCAIRCDVTSNLCPDGVSYCIDGFCKSDPQAACAPDTIPDAAQPAIDADLTVDTDGDTVPDALDNCPLVPNDQFRNHDGDARGDECDPCPHLVGATADEDPDGDGLGNGCDPEPNVAGDGRLAFFGFYMQDDLAGWRFKPVLGTANGWKLQPGFLQFANTNTTDATADSPISAQNVFVQARITGRNQASFNPRFVAVSVRRAGTNFHNCNARTTGAASNVIDYTVFTAPETIEVTPGPPWKGQLVNDANVITHHVDGANAKCAVVGIQSMESAMMAPQMVKDRSGDVGIVTTQVAIDIDYIFIARSGP